MRKKLVVRSERLRSLTTAERAAIVGGVPTGACQWPDPPPRVIAETGKTCYHCGDPWPPPPPGAA